MKYAHHDAHKVALELRAELAPYVHRIEIVGSLRRMRPMVSDAELLFVPRIETRANPISLFGDTYDADVASEYLDALLAQGVLAKRVGENGVSTAWGEKNKLAIHTATGIPIDFFATNAANWAVSMVIRTGPKELNLKLTTSAQARGERLMAYGEGYRLQNGTVIPMHTEQEVFAHVGLPYREPKDRTPEAYK